MNKNNFILKLSLILILITLAPTNYIYSQFVDNFNGNSIALDTNGINGWAYRTGDGNAVMDFYQSNDGFASVSVDAGNDTRGIWWALIKRRVSENMNLSLLGKAGYVIRAEARIRVSNAPKRVNLHLNTQRTTDFHSNLMEYDIPDTNNWHIISLTLKDFDAIPGDTVYGQMALMDWGFDEYRVDIDYYKVDIIKINSTDEDMGNPIPYHPPVPDAGVFEYHLPVYQDATVNTEFRDMNFNNWMAWEDGREIPVLSVDGTNFVIFRWDLSMLKGKHVKGAGLLEVTTYTLEKSGKEIKDFGMIRVTEIINGDSRWNQNDVTFNSLCKGNSLKNVLNSQMIIDVDINNKKGERNFITISQPVLQRMIDGKTIGLALIPLGSINASFYSMENNNIGTSAKLHLNFK